MSTSRSQVHPNADPAAAQAAAQTDGAPADISPVRLTWLLQFDSTSPAAALALSTRVSAADASQRGVRIAYLTFWILVALLGAFSSTGDVRVCFALSAGGALVAVFALTVAPRAATALSSVAASLFIALLGARYAFLLRSPCGDGGTGHLSDFLSPLAFMPVVHTALLRPRVAHMLPVLAAHVAHATLLFTTLSPSAYDAAASTAAVVLCACFAFGNMYVAERELKQRVLVEWRLEDESRRREAATKIADAARDDLKHFESAEAYICHELRNALHGIRGILDALISGRTSAVRCAGRRHFAFRSLTIA